MEKILVLDENDYGLDLDEICRVAVRGIIFIEGKLLLIENDFGEVKLPGGGIDSGEDDYKALAREVKEETGYDVQVNSLEGIFDTNLDTQNPQLFQYYKLIFECSIIKGEFEKNIETSNINFFDIQNLPPLSEKRTTKDQLTKLLLSKSSDAYFE